MDRYAHLAPGAGDRSCRRKDGGPKRRLTEGAALLTVEAAAACDVELHAYECPTCPVDTWHVASGPEWLERRA